MQTLKKIFRYFPHYVELLGKRLNGKGNMDPHNNGEYKILRKAIEHTKNNPFVYIDGGANVGENVVQANAYSVELKKPIKIIAIEPVQQTFNILKSNTKPIKAILVNKALGNSMAPLKIQVDPANPCSGSNSALPHYYLKKGVNETVKQTTLDQLTADLKLDRIDFLKLDIEGLELDAIKGAANLLKNGAIDYIQLEYNQTWIKAGSSIEELIEFTSSKGYSLFRIAPNELLRITSYHYTVEDFSYSNLLLVKNSCALPLNCNREVSPATSTAKQKFKSQE